MEGNYIKNGTSYPIGFQHQPMKIHTLVDQNMERPTASWWSKGTDLLCREATVPGQPWSP